VSARAVLEELRGRLVVSCQAPDDHPLRDTQVMVAMARAAEQAGAAAIRCGGYGGVADIRAIRTAVTCPVIGLTKEGTTGVYLTPTLDAARRVCDAGATVVAADATLRPRPDGSTVAQAITLTHALGRLFMADVDSADAGLAAAAAGADIVATTLAARAGDGGPDLALVARLRAELPADVFVVAEGHCRTPADARAARVAGADAVVVGTAITDTRWIAARFVDAVAGIDAPTA